MSETALLDSCRDIAATRLSEELAQTLAHVVSELAELVSKMPSQEMYSLYMDSMELARDKSAAITSGFKKHFFTRFNDEKRRVLHESNGQSGGRNLDMSKLSLLEPDDLEQTLAADTIANAIANSCGEELFGLGKRLGVLLNEPDLKTEQIPLGPNAIGAALLDAMQDQNASVKIKLLLVTRINKRLPAKVRVVFQELNQHLIKHNVLPTIRAGINRTTPAPAHKPSDPGVPAGNPVGNLGGNLGGNIAANAGQDMFAMLQQLISFGRAGMAPAMPGLPSLPELPGSQEFGAGTGISGGQGGSPNMGHSLDPAVLHTLTQLQHGRIEGLGLNMGNLNANLIADGHTNVLRELKNSQAAGMFGQMDAMTLDIVVLVFDYILGDNRIPDAMKALIGRLQIPVLKVTMIDKTFFSQKAHPVRRLLDSLADASLGWDPEEGHDSSLYQKVEQLVQLILNQFDDGLDVFAEALSEFQNYMAEEKQVSDQLATRSAQFLRTREQLAIGQVAAHDAIVASLLDHPTPVPIHDFLLAHWERLLAKHYVETGENSPEWNNAVATMNDLLWSLTPKTDKEERRKLIELLPQLLKRIDSGIDALQIEQSVRDAFFSDLVKCHAVAVKAGFRDGQAEIDPAMTSATSQYEIPDLSDQTAPVFSTQDFVDIPVLTDSVAPDDALLQEIGAVEADTDDLEEITIGDVRGETWDEPRDSHFETQVKHLKRGTWIEFIQDDGSALRAKLAWISPLQGTYLFTNRLGKRAVSINSRGLAAKFREGHAQIIDNVPLIERAVNNVFEHFQRRA
ncbi:MAG: hypothetical protein B7Y41_14430 [Hydrogenophilales bacterium 28-61-23]|nr:MAG: hypothetical protein B7Y41_14430 [Hydrogenophilales bacterium 28-61-23]